MRAFLFIFLYIVACFCSVGQISDLKALEKKAAGASTDSERVFMLIEASRGFYAFDSIESAFSIALRATEIAERSHSPKLKNEANLHQTFLFTVKGEFKQALEVLNSIEKSVAQVKDDEQKKNFFITKGRVLSSLGNYSEALKYSLQALSLTERDGDVAGKGKILNNIGILYDYTGDKEKALYYYKESLKIKTEKGDERGAANSYANIGEVYRFQKKYDSAFYYTNKCLEIGKTLDDYNLLSLAFTNLGSIFLEKNEPLKALEYIRQALKVDSILEEESGICQDLINIGQAYFLLKKYDLAERYMKEGLNKGVALGSMENIKIGYEWLSKTYFVKGDFEHAYHALSEFKRYNDTLYNIENAKQFNDLKTQYEVDKKATELEQKGFEEKIKHEQESKRQKVIIYFMSFTALLVLTLFILSVRAYRGKQKANRIIMEQKEMVEQKNKEVMDSINYAHRIQKSLLPTDKYMERNLKKFKK